MPESLLAGSDPGGGHAVVERRRRLRSVANRAGFWLLLLAIAAAVAWGVERSRAPAVETAPVLVRDLEQHLVASGRVRVVSRVALAARVAGEVVAVHAAEGQRVRAGDLLVQLDDREVRAAVDEAKAAVGQATARLADLRHVQAVVSTEATREATANLARATEQLARVETLANSGAVATADVDEARRAVTIAQARRVAAAAEAAASGPQGTDVREATSRLRESEARLEAAAARQAWTRVLAPQDAIVLSRAVEPGDTVQPGTLLVELAPEARSELVIELDERHLASVRHGQHARASADAFPERSFEAEVGHIAPAIDPRRGSVEVRLWVPDPPAFLRPEMTVSVDLTVASAERTLTVPSEAVREAATANPWVLAVEDRRLVRRSVELGIRGDGHTEITAGLAEGDEVVVSPATGLAPGRRVRPRRGGG